MDRGGPSVRPCLHQGTKDAVVPGGSPRAVLTGTILISAPLLPPFFAPFEQGHACERAPEDT